MMSSIIKFSWISQFIKKW